jgi:hypothetical protein
MLGQMWNFEIYDALYAVREEAASVTPTAEVDVWHRHVQRIVKRYESLKDMVEDSFPFAQCGSSLVRLTVFTT